MKTVLLRHPLICAGVGAALLAAAGIGVYRGMYEYIRFRDFKTVRRVKLLHFDGPEHRPCEMTLPVKFVPRMHDAGVVEKHLVRTENGKSFLIFRFDDGRVQLVAFPARKYPGIGWMTAFYDVTDAAAERRLREAVTAP